MVGISIPDGDIWYQLTILLTLALGCHFLVTRFRQPMIVAVIIVGIIVGPTLLNFVSNIEAVAIFAQLGAIVLLFAIGLESDIRAVYTKRTIFVAIGGVIIPWFAGVFFGLLTGENFSVSVFIGATLTATSLAVTASILMDMGKLDTAVGKTIIGAAVVDDVLAMLVLSISFGMIGGVINVNQIIYITVVTILFIFVGGLVASKYIGKAVMYIEKRTTGVQHSGFLFAIAVMFFYSFLSELIGISAIVGAFVAGAVFSTVPIRKEFHTGTRFLSTVFTPIFFISIGIMANFKGISIQFLLIALVFSIIAVLTKILGCGMFARVIGHTTKESFIVGYAMAPRGEVALAIALTGLSLGIIGQYLYSLIVFMAIFTTLVTPPILKMIFLHKNHVKDKGLKSCRAKKQKEE